LTITEPVPRWRVVAQRAITLTVMAALVAAVGSSVIAFSAPGQGMALAWR